MIKRVAVALALLASTLVGVAPAASAAAKRYPLNPSANIPAPSYVFGGACRSAPTSRDCTSLFMRALNDARATMGQPAYVLPSRFRALTPAERLLVLANADRVLYDRVPISGLNATLNASAQQGVREDRDPDFVYTLDGAPLQGGSGNWAGGGAPMNNPLYAYYVWMYDDGPGSGNIDCQKAGDPGCWGHRDGTLAGFGTQNKVVLGVGGGTDSAGRYGWTELFEAFPNSAAIRQIPTVTGLAPRLGSAGQRMHVVGYGLYGVTEVTLVGVRGTVTEKHVNSLYVTIPRGSGSGWAVVHTAGGISAKTDAAAFAFA